MDSLSLESGSEAETERIAQRLGSLLRGGDMLGLEGELGAGKTVFARALGYALGVESDVPITSPTFALLQHYDARMPYVHGDLYRLNAARELQELGIEEFKEQGAVVVLEWAERFAAQFPEMDLWVRLALRGEQARAIELSAASERGRQILTQFSR